MHAAATARASDFERIVWRDLLPWVPRQPAQRDPARRLYLQARACDDAAEAVRLLEQAATAGHAAACFHLGLVIHTHAGTGFDYRAAMECYARAARQGVLAAEYNRQQLVRLELDALLRDADLDAPALLPLAEQGDPVAQALVAHCARDGAQGLRADPAAALDWYRRAADQGHAQAQHGLAAMLEAGEGGPADLAEAARLYEAAAGQGIGESALRLGLLYRDGRGVAQDDEAAARWVKAAVDAGSSEAEAILAALPAGVLNQARTLLARCDAARAAGGAGMPSRLAINEAAVDVAILGDHPDHALAFALYRHAAELGHADAQQQVGWAYLRGLGAPQDTAAGLEWLERAAGNGSVYAQELLAQLHEEGECVPRNPELARAWWSKAAAQGSWPAEAKLGLRESLDPTRFETSIALVAGDAAARGDAPEWGERIAEYRPSAAPALLAAVVLGVPGLLMLADGSGFGVVLLLAAGLVGWSARRHRVQVYTGALVRRTLLQGTRSVKLGPATHYHYRSVRETGRVHPGDAQWLLVDDGVARMRLGGNLREVDQLHGLLRMAEKRDFLGRAAEAYRRGQELDFGVLRLHEGRMHAGRRSIALQEIVAVRAQEGCLHVHAASGKRFVKAPLVRVPNAWSLLGLLEALAPLGTVALQPLQPNVRIEEAE